MPAPVLVPHAVAPRPVLPAPLAAPNAHAQRAEALLSAIVADAVRVPAAAAVRGATAWDRGALLAAAGGVQGALAAAGAGPGTAVALLLARDAWAPAALLGVLAAGAACVPLDPADPPARRDAVLAATGARLVVASPVHVDAARALAGGVPLVLDAAVLPDARVPVPVPVDDGATAYVLHTSGSTGAPKGVRVTRGALAHYVFAMRDALGVASGDTWVHTASFAFSSAMRQLLVPLVAGGAVAIADEATRRDPAALRTFVAAHGATILDLVPSHLAALVEHLEVTGARAPASLRLLLTASEPCWSGVARRWRAVSGGVRHVNMFGQTETAGIVALHEVGAADLHGEAVLPLGRPLAGVALDVVDHAGHPVAPGATGELRVRGATVDGGYLHADAHQRFAGSGDARQYRTGDLVRLDGDGVLHWLGRADDQVKVRGQRVEPAGVEAALRGVTGVRDCTVIARRDASGDAHLVAYVVADPAPALATLRAALAARLPAHAMPRDFGHLPALPRSRNGKVDRAALPAPSWPGDAAVAGDVVDAAVLAALRAATGVEQLALDDDLLAVGGDSMRLTRAAVQLQRVFGVAGVTTALFLRPQARAIAAHVRAHGGAPESTRIAAGLLAALTADGPAGSPG